MAGSTAEVQPLSRAALECAGYAAHLKLNPALETVWAARADRTDEAAKKAVRGQFGHNKVCESVDRLDAEIGSAYRDMYEAAIDLGAHPNVIGVVSSFKLGQEASGQTLEHHILTDDVGKILLSASLVGQVGLISIQILRLVFPESKLTDQDMLVPLNQIIRLGQAIKSLAATPDDADG